MGKDIEDVAIEMFDVAFAKNGYKLKFEKWYNKTVSSYYGKIKELNEQGGFAFEFTIKPSLELGDRLELNADFQIGILFRDPIGIVAIEEIKKYNNLFRIYKYFDIKILDDKIFTIYHRERTRFKIGDQYAMKSAINKVIDGFFQELSKDKELEETLRLSIAESKVLPFLKKF